MPQDTVKGAAIYSPLVLKMYDSWVLGFSNRFVWKCSTQKVLLPFFKRNVGLRHLDVGAGTGFYPYHAELPAQSQITLMDFNPRCLQLASARLRKASTQTIQHDAMTPLPPQDGGAYDSISLFYLLHCLPGNVKTKSAVLANLKHHLKPDGVLYGATILGDSVSHNTLGKKLMKVYNRKGIFSNHHDNASDLIIELTKHFEEIDVRIEGKVALFEVRRAVK